MEDDGQLRCHNRDGSLTDGCFFAGKKHPVVVIEYGGWYCDDESSRHLLQHKYEEQTPKPQEVLGTVSHGNIFGFSRR